MALKGLRKYNDAIEEINQGLRLETSQNIIDQWTKDIEQLRALQEGNSQVIGLQGLFCDLIFFRHLL